MGHLAVPDPCAVQPQVKAGIHPFKIEIRLRRLPVLYIVKRMHICAAGVVLGNKGRIKGKRITDIGVLVGVIPGHLPHTGDADLPKIRRIIARLVKRLLHVIDALKESELPVPVQELDAVGFLPVFR